ncbi:hypothetical protein PILCRDRAFT_483681 [Piloderma croceum F 1598]|uniref:Uncharacterized protein n=1 Tax=Piloderma croceum (strain F 1598) TaxID=765440 RepID=A0A0C3BXA0_PILCF|nr:hypothetical protein PILCRDRAFT_483681 [Piloderma croceum F 1598]
MSTIGDFVMSYVLPQWLEPLQRTAGTSTSLHTQFMDRELSLECSSNMWRILLAEVFCNKPGGLCVAPPLCSNLQPAKLLCRLHCLHHSMGHPSLSCRTTCICFVEVEHYSITSA